ncbi:DDIT3 protein, partial [Bucco capensis]|nr:DDIT3 protein [Bucco capensis]
MAAEGLPAAGGPGWELEAWYQDLQEVLATAEPLEGPCPSWGAEQGASGGPECCELDAALAAELLELLGPESSDIAEPPAAASTACGRSSPPRLSPGQEEEEEAAGRGRKRKRRSGAGSELAKRREQANEQRVLELRAHNEQLREEIARLSGEVQRTRAALIQRILSLRPG